MKTYCGSGSTAPRILDLGTRWRWVVSFTHRSLYLQGKSPWYPLDRRLGGPQSRSGRGGEEKNSQCSPGLEPPLIQSVAQRHTTKSSQLLEETVHSYILDIQQRSNVRRISMVTPITTRLKKMTANTFMTLFSSGRVLQRGYSHVGYNCPPSSLP
jgi:hypothetical protein